MTIDYEDEDWLSRECGTARRMEAQAEGFAQGAAEATADSVITVLTVRRLAVFEAQRARIEQCRDLIQLDRWLRRALEIESAAEIFD
ncbi:hypothetical protein [Nocardia sp. NPDC050718]|uniref:hypothetical protein n=1 Tax=Nocardia sp. NPDC050718 TaxID=3155788 RepID=UPI0033F2CC6C